MKKKIFIDYDETLVDIVTPTLQWIKEVLGEKVKKSDITYYSYLQDKYGSIVVNFWNEPDLYKNLYNITSPFDGAVNFIRILNDMNYEISILSNCSEKNYIAKIEHCMKHFGIKSFIPCFDGGKYKYLKRDDILIDDHFANCISHIMINGGKAIQFNYKGETGWAKDSKFTTYESLIKEVNLLRILSNNEI